MSRHTLVLIDGMSALYRSFYAIKELSTSKGRPTNAVYGFVRMLNQLKETWAPTHWAVVFDGGLPEERTELLEDYKAQRPPTPDTLYEQIDTVEDYLARAGIAWTRLEGEEADDVIASIATQAVADCKRILIASSDKDFYQIVTDKIRMIKTSGKEPETMGPSDVKTKTGVEPSQIIEWLAMVGDSVDNIPGVSGVGTKTAATLLGEYDTVEGIWKHIDDIGREKLRETLRASREIVARNIDLIRLRLDLESSLDWEAMEVKSPDPALLLPLLDELEFHGMAKTLREPELFG